MTPSQTLEEAESALVAFRARGLELIAHPSHRTQAAVFLTDVEDLIRVLSAEEMRVHKIRVECEEIKLSVARSRELPF